MSRELVLSFGVSRNPLILYEEHSDIDLIGITTGSKYAKYIEELIKTYYVIWLLIKFCQSLPVPLVVLVMQRSMIMVEEMRVK